MLGGGGIAPDGLRTYRRYRRRGLCSRAHQLSSKVPNHSSKGIHTAEVGWKAAKADHVEAVEMQRPSRIVVGGLRIGNELDHVSQGQSLVVQLDVQQGKSISEIDRRREHLVLSDAQGISGTVEDRLQSQYLFRIGLGG